MGVYAGNLARELAKGARGPELCLLGGKSNLAALPFSAGGIPVIPTKVAHDSHPLGDLWEHLVLPGRLRGARVDLVHGPAALVPLLSRGFKTVVTIHDLVPFTHPDTVPKKYATYMRALLRRSVKRVDHIITDSRSTQYDLVKLLAVDPARVSVTPLAASDEFRPIDDDSKLDQVCKRHGITRPFVLYLGNLEPRKNLVRLAWAFKRTVRQLGGGVQLVIGGQAAWLAERLQAGWQDLETGREVVFTGYLAQEELPLLMNAAKVFAFPSLYEGFGLPVLEALACGTPVLTSDRGSLPEVAGDAALIIDPEDVGQMAGALERILCDTELSAKLAEAGPIQAAKFSWARCAQETSEIYQRVAGQVARK